MWEFIKRCLGWQAKQNYFSGYLRDSKDGNDSSEQDILLPVTQQSATSEPKRSSILNSIFLVLQYITNYLTTGGSILVMTATKLHSVTRSLINPLNQLIGFVKKEKSVKKMLYIPASVYGLNPVAWVLGIVAGGTLGYIESDAHLTESRKYQLASFDPESLSTLCGVDKNAADLLTKELHTAKFLIATRYTFDALNDSADLALLILMLAPLLGYDDSTKTILYIASFLFGFSGNLQGISNNWNAYQEDIYRKAENLVNPGKASLESQEVVPFGTTVLIKSQYLKNFTTAFVKNGYFSARFISSLISSELVLLGLSYPAIAIGMTLGIISGISNAKTGEVETDFFIQRSTQQQIDVPLTTWQKTKVFGHYLADFLNDFSPLALILTLAYNKKPEEDYTLTEVALYFILATIPVVGNIAGGFFKTRKAYQEDNMEKLLKQSLNMQFV